MFRWGDLSVTVTSASITSVLDSASNCGLSLKNIVYIDELNINFNVNLFDFQRLRTIIKRRGDTLRLTHRFGGYYYLLNLIKRPVILTFFVLWLFLHLFLQGRILFFRVEGNSYISDFEILNAVQDCGIRFGTPSRNVKSEKVKNALLEQMKQLKWAGVNLKGCVVTISVKESAIPERNANEIQFGNMVAVSDGVITEITVTAGTPICKVGQAVRKGQVLVSGYSDCGLITKSSGVKGEVYAITRRKIDAFAVNPTFVRSEIVSKDTFYSVQLGKNIINLKKYSGILDGGCVKMYEKRNLALPGGFYLPVAIIKETVIRYAPRENDSDNIQNFDYVGNAVDLLYSNAMLAGEILHKTVEGKPLEKGYWYSGYYLCREMIGRVRAEGLSFEYGKRNN